jgi:hypothetical protein
MSFSQTPHQSFSIMKLRDRKTTRYMLPYIDRQVNRLLFANPYTKHAPARATTRPPFTTSRSAGRSITAST